MFDEGEGQKSPASSLSGTNSDAIHTSGLRMGLGKGETASEITFPLVSPPPYVVSLALVQFLLRALLQ